MDEEIKLIAQRLRGLRDSLDCSTEEMAKIAGISVEEYQDMEAGNVDISVSTLQAIARHSGIALDVLMFGEEPKMSSYFLTRAEKGVSVERSKAYKYQSLASGFIGRIVDPFEVIVEPLEGDQTPRPNSHVGQEFNLVVEGRMLISIGGKELILSKGDSIYFNSELPHYMKALDGKSVKFLAVIC